MAWLEQDPSGTYHVAFRLGSRRFKRSLQTSTLRRAESRRCRLEETLELVNSGRLEVPPGSDIPTFLLSDGKVPTTAPKQKFWSLKGAYDEYLKQLPEGALEENSLRTFKTHLKHILRVLGKHRLLRDIGLSELQRFVDRRSREAGARGRKVSPQTIKKEMSSFSSLWSWAQLMGYVDGPFPKRGLKYPKTYEKPPFQTSQQIRSQIERGGLSDAEVKGLWDCLVLTTEDLDTVLTHVRKFAQQPFLYPMLVTAGHTGARRSELLRSRLSDLDFEARTITFREKKRVKGCSTTRTVPMSPMVVTELKRWVAEHPGGPYTFQLGEHVLRSRKARSLNEPLTVNESTHHLRTALKDSTWRHIRGWHVFRHSFASICACRGVDQRMINEWMGHQTEEMVKRYRHLFPDSQSKALAAVFG